MSDPPIFNGSESPADIAKAAIEWFSQKPSLPSITIIYENSIPKLKYEFQGGDAEYVCVYRLDKMLESFYSAAEQIFAENLRAGFVKPGERAILLPYLAFSGMTAMLSHLVVLLAQVVLETIEDTKMLTAGVVLHSLVANSKHQSSLSRPASKIIQGWINDLVTATMKKKRDYLVGYMNKHRFFHIGARGGSEPRVDVTDAQCKQMASAYRSLLGHWQKTNRNRKKEKNWRAYAKIDQPDTPDDLLDRLDDLPTGSELDGDDYPNIPSAIAHEHAARRCEIEPNEYSLSRLKDFRKRGEILLRQSKTDD